jgi:hypothetical protein
LVVLTIPFDGDLVRYRKEPWERDMPRATTQASITSQTITVEHIRISSELSFAEVRRKFEGTVPKLDTGIAEALRGGKKRINDPPPQPTLPAIRHAIVDLIIRSSPRRCPYCQIWIGAQKQRE